MPGLESAAGLLALLTEEQQLLQVHGLRGLLSVVDEHWAEVSGSVSQIEAFYEDDAFPQRELAALLASKVFYHLGELNDSLTYALGAGSLFDVTEQSEFVQTMLGATLAEPAGNWALVTD
jgi:26S proteasome regulatory subunit N2